MHRPRQRGSVVLVALCFVAVIGIALASYLAVSTQAMKQSNRSYAKDISRHLAEMGLERALHSFNDNPTYFSSGWTLSGITATPAAQLSISSTHYGNTGITTAINLRVDHYLATNKATVWSPLTTYNSPDFVWYQGIWYLCTVGPPSYQDPSNTSYWKGAPEPWNATANYQIGNIAVSGGNAYRCTTANINQAPPNATYWASQSAAAWNSATSYAVDDVVFAGGTSYRCILAHTNHAPPNTTYWLSSPLIYAEGVVTLPDGTAPIKTQLRALIAPAPLFPNALGAATLVTLSNTTDTVDSYNSVLGAYNQTTAPFSPGSPNLTYSAVLAGGNTAGTAVTVTSGTVRGYVAVPSNPASPYAPLWSYGGSAKLLGPVDVSGVNLTRVSRSPNVPQFDIQSVVGAINLPNGTTILNGATTLGTPGQTNPDRYNVTGTYDTNTSILYSGLYINSAADNLTIDGPVILNVTGPLGTNLGKITITANGSLEIYFTGVLTVNNGSNVGIQNLVSLDPKKCLLVGTSNVNIYGSHYYWSTDPFYGIIYMPNAYVRIRSNVTIFGAISASNIRFSSANTTLHYDTSLRTAGKIGTFIDGPYLISELRELTDPAERVTLP